MPNTWQPNAQTLNGPAGSAGVVDWEALAPVERQRVYVFDVGSLRLPISSAQATMRLTGQSFLQAVVPAGDQYIEALTTLKGQPMALRSGYRFADGSLSPLEVIATAPFDMVRPDEGTRGVTLTLTGYGNLPAVPVNTRTLQEVRYRSTDASGKRRVRAGIDLFLKPGHTAVDSDGISFTVGVIQYFINASSESMEVLQDG